MLTKTLSLSINAFFQIITRSIQLLLIFFTLVVRLLWCNNKQTDLADHLEIAVIPILTGCNIIVQYEAKFYKY